MIFPLYIFPLCPKQKRRITHHIPYFRLLQGNLHFPMVSFGFPLVFLWIFPSYDLPAGSDDPDRRVHSEAERVQMSSKLAKKIVVETWLQYTDVVFKPMNGIFAP